MKTLVTGAAGFIGSHLCEALLARGDDVIAVDTLTDYYAVEQKRSNLSVLQGQDRCRILEADASATDTLELLAEVDVVYHLAGQPGVRLSWDTNFDVYVERNILLTQRLLEAARRHGLPRMVLASSSSIYGNQPTYPVDESARPEPFSPYGVTKLAAENLATLYAHNYGLSTVSLRYFTVYGPRQRPDMAFSKFVRNTLAGKPIPITGDGSAVRDFTFVGDIVDATIAAGTESVRPGSVFNVCGSESVTVNDVLRLLAAELGELDVHYSSSVPGDVLQTGGDSSRARNELGWSAQTDLAQGIGAQVAWERAR